MGSVAGLQLSIQQALGGSRRGNGRLSQVQRLLRQFHQPWVAKLQEYYTITDDSNIYRVATALQPGKRFYWFESEWAQETGGQRDINNCRLAAKRAWKRYAETTPATSSSEALRSSPVRPRAPKRRVHDSDDDDDDDNDDNDDDTSYWRSFGSYNVRLPDDPHKEAKLERFLKADIELAE